MARVRALKKEELQGEAKEAFEIIEKRYGMVPNLFATIAHCPKALKPLLDLHQAIRKESSIDPKLQELANLEASRINRCNYCLAHHTATAKKVGLKNEQIEAVLTGNIAQGFSEKEKAVVEYSRCVTEDAENVPDNLFTRLKSYFSDAELVNLTLIIGLINVFNRVNGALKIDLEK